jgi:capsular exopolysaccharide synthesis family protein
VQDQRISTIFWRGKWIIIAAVVVGALLAVLITKRTEKVYQASVVIQVNAAGTAGTNQSPSDVQVANQVLAQTYATLIGDRSLLEAVRSSIEGGTLSAAEILSRISARAVTNTALVELSAEGPSPAEARRLADDVANAFVVYEQSGARANSESQQSKLRDQITGLSRQISQLQAKASTPAIREQLDSLRGARSTLQTQLSNVIANGIEQGGSVRVAAPSTASSIPVRPRPMLNLLAGILLGILAGAGLSWLRLRLDRGLHGPEEVEELMGAPVLASVPVRKRFSNDDPVLGEAFDVLRANIAFLSHDQPLQVLTMSSFNPREGKTSTSTGLAFAAGRGGMTVVLVDADIRTRTLTERLGYADAPGLTNVVVGAVSLEEALIELAPGVSLLPAGPMPPNPPSLLSSARMRELLDELRSQFSLVVLDSPPVAHLADASILASISDGVVVVARVGVTDREDLVNAAANLRHSPTPIIGVVLLESRTIDETYYPAVSKGLPEAVEEPAETI